MPTRAPTPCIQSGCPNPVTAGARCHQHQRPDAWSRGAHGRLMPRGWDRTRARVLRRDPICTLALPGCTMLATEVDHIVRGAGEHDANLRGVCAACHRAKTQAEAAAARQARA